MRRALARAGLLLACSLGAAGCVPRVQPLEGAPAPARLPRAELPAVHRQQILRWEFADPDFRARGEGVARTAPPDSARLDLFISGMFGGSGVAFLIGDSIVAPGGALVRRFIPAAPLMWAALGRLAVPPAADTTVRVDGDTLRADIGSTDRWRATFVGERLVRLERIAGGRIQEWVSRTTPDDIRYRHEGASRSLDITITRTETVPAFDASIWPPSPPR